MRRILLLAAALLCINAHAADGLPPGVTLLKPEQMKWEKSASGRENAYLMGHPSKAGPYLYWVKWPPNAKALAHKHPLHRHGMVVSGVHYIGYGEK